MERNEMAIDWDALVLAPLNAVFGERITYYPRSGSPFDITGVFDTAYTNVALDGNGDPGVISVRPVCGVRLSEFPAGFKPEAAQKDELVRVSTGVRYTVKAGKPDGHGHARIELNRIS
jgi:hypothetical protein